MTITVNAVNDPPVATNDSYSTNEDTTLTVAAPGVLGNDTDVDGDPLTAVLVSGPSHGTLTLNANGSVGYTPAANYNGSDSFTYKTRDGVADSNVATVTITVNAVNDSPVATNDSYSTNQDTTLTVAAPGVLGNDTDVDGDPLTAVLMSGPSHGALTLNANGSVSYTPAANYFGSDSFTYTISDGHGGTASAIVTVTVAPTPPSALVAAYSFNEGSGTQAFDISGSNNTGTISGPLWTGAGKFGQALSFDGINDWITIADANSLDLTNGMTLEAWVKPAALTSWRSVLLKETSGGLVYGLYASDGASHPQGTVHTGTTDSAAPGSTPLAINTWTHLATSYDGALLKTYVNGSLVSSVGVTGNLANSTGALRVGGNAIWGEFFSGVIDEVRVYRRALSASEIQTDMNTPVGGVPVPDTTPPMAAITAPTNGALLSGTTTVTASASDNVAVAGVQFLLDGTPLGAEDITAPFAVVWDTRTTTNGSHTLTARARDGAGNQATSPGVATTVSNSILPPGLVAALGFNEGAGSIVSDRSGSGNDGTISGATWAATGKYGKALSFNGVTNWVTIADANSLDLTTGMTLEAWVNPSALSGWRTALLKENSNGLAYGLYANDGSPRPSVTVNVAGADRSAIATSQLPLNTWTHLAATYDGATLRLFANGVQAGSLALSGAMTVSASPLRIGGNAVWGEYFTGLIDEVRVYNRALGQAEIQTDMNTPIN